MGGGDMGGTGVMGGWMCGYCGGGGMGAKGVERRVPGRWGMDGLV